MTEHEHEDPAPSPLLLAGTAVLGLAALTFAFAGLSYFAAAPWGWQAAAVAVASVALVALRGRPERRPLVFPAVWLWALLTGTAVFGALWPAASGDGETVSTSAGEFIMPSSHWESLGVSLLSMVMLIWFFAMLITGVTLLLHSVRMSAAAGAETVTRWRDRHPAGRVRP